MAVYQSTSEVVTTRSGFVELRRRWRCADPWAAALIVHGAAEHSGRFELVGNRLSAAGIDTRSFDLQGCGGSGGRRADIDHWSTFLLQVGDNLAPLLAADLPVVLFGHSVRGLIAVDYTFSAHPQPDLVVLHAPVIGVVASAWQRKIAPWLARLAPRLTFANPIRPEEVFSDPATVELVRADPLATTRTTVRLGAILLDRMDRVGSSLDEYTARTLVLHGTADTLVLSSISESIGDLPSVDRRVCPGLKHGTIMERQGLPLIDDITWVGEQIGEGPRDEEQAGRHR